MITSLIILSMFFGFGYREYKINNNIKQLKQELEQRPILIDEPIHTIWGIV